MPVVQLSLVLEPAGFMEFRVGEGIRKYMNGTFPSAHTLDIKRHPHEYYVQAMAVETEEVHLDLTAVRNLILFVLVDLIEQDATMRIKGTIRVDQLEITCQ